jgi:hypothetical protein
MATRKDLLAGLTGVGTGFSKMGQMMMERERFDTQKALEEEENIRKRDLHGPAVDAAKAGADLAGSQAKIGKVSLSETLATADKRKDADAANQALMAENAAAGWQVDPDDQGSLGTWKAELNALNRFRSKEGKPALSVQEFVTAKKGEKFERTKATAAEQRAGEAHADDLKTSAANRTLTFANAGRVKTGSDDSVTWQTTDTDKGKVQVNPKTGETRSLTGPDGKPLHSAKEPGIKLNEAQTKTLGAAGMAKTMLNELASKFKGGGLGGAGGFVADVTESIPFVGGKMAPKTAEYNDQRRIVAETFLREATGAAAPAPEVKFYTNLLPEPGDSEAQAQSALNAFRGAVKAKVKGVAETLRAQGREADAKSIEQNLNKLFSDSEDIKTRKPEDLSDDELDAQLRAKGIDPTTGKKLRVANGAQ